MRYSLIRESVEAQGLEVTPEVFRGVKGTATAPVSDEAAADMAWSFQNVATKHLQQRLRRAIDRIMAKAREEEDERLEVEKSSELKPLENQLRHVVVCGGVASNKHIRAALAETIESKG